MPPGPAAKQRVVIVAAVHGNDGAGIQREGIGQFDISAFGLGEHHVGGHIIVVIEQDVGFHAAHGAAVLGPGKQAQTKCDGGGF